MLNPFLEVINQFLPEPQAGLLAGILFGVRSSFSKEFYQALITTGTVHIVALSGQNISILINILGVVFMYFGRKISLVLTILSVIGFVLFVGIAPPIVRAALMGSLALTATLFGRKQLGLLSLFITVGIMLILFPGWAFEISFQLSFMATLGILLFAKKKINPNKAEGLVKTIKTEVGDSLRLTLSAQAFTLPIILIYFKQISLIAPVANVLIFWAITPIMVLGFIFALVGFLLPGVAGIFAALVYVPLTFVVIAVEMTSKIPFAVLHFK